MKAARLLLLWSCAVALPAPALFAESRLVFPRVTLQSGRFSGIAIANTSTVEARVRLTAFLPDGSPLSGNGIPNPVEIVVPASGQFSGLARDTFPFQSALGEAVLGQTLWVEAGSTTDGLVWSGLGACGAILRRPLTSPAGGMQ